MSKSIKVYTAATPKKLEQLITNDIKNNYYPKRQDYLDCAIGDHEMNKYKVTITVEQE